jgi:hypothetical protein
MDQKLAVIAETMQPVDQLTSRAFAERGVPVETAEERRRQRGHRADEDVVQLRKLEEWMRDLERLLRRKTMEVEMLK